MDYYGKFSQKKTPDTNIYLVSEISHPVEPAIEQILKTAIISLRKPSLKLQADSL